MKKRLIGALLFWIIVVPAAASAGVMGLWNLLMPELLGVAAIGFGQAVGLFLLGNLLSGGFALGALAMSGTLHRMYHHDTPLHRKWKEMTDEQRRAFFEQRRRFGSGHLFGGDHLFEGERPADEKHADEKQTDEQKEKRHE